ncbi:MAG: glycosyltransferase family 39 protein [Anaerolineaceae bacterium]
MIFILSILILVFSTLFFSALLRLRRGLEFPLAWGLISFASIVLVFQAANLLHALDSAALIILLQSILLGISALGWLLAGKPALFPPIFNIRQTLSRFKIREHGALTALCLVVAVVLLLSLVLIYVVPPNNNDALSYHVARIVRWMQQGTYFPWETPFIWQLSFPVNAQLTYLWTLLLSGTDHFIAYIPFLAGTLTSLLVYLFAREFGYSRRGSVFAGLIWLTFPVVQLHLTSVRHDLISTWLFISLVYFFYRWGKEKQLGALLLSSLALGLVLGTNFSIAAYLPGFALLALTGFWTYKYKLKHALVWLCAALLAFGLFSSPIYISNQLNFGSPVGPDAAEMTSTAVEAEMPRAKYIALTSARWAYQLADFSWLPRSVQAPLTTAKAAATRVLTGPVGLNLEGDIATLDAHVFSWDRLYQLQEDEAWFGLIGFLLIFPTSIIGFVQALKKKEALRAFPFILYLTALVTCSLIRPGWTPFDGRYFMPAVALASAFLPMWFEGKRPRDWVQWILVLTALFSSAMVTLYNPAKQIVGGAAVWNMNRIDKLTRQSYSSKEMLYLAEQIPTGAVVGVAAEANDYQEYGLFGADFSRRVVNVYPVSLAADQDWLRARGVQYLLVRSSGGSSPEVADNYQAGESLGDWLLYKQKP